MVKKKFAFTTVEFITVEGNNIVKNEPETFLGHFKEAGALKILKERYPEKKIAIINVEYKSFTYGMTDEEFYLTATKINEGE